MKTSLLKLLAAVMLVMVGLGIDGEGVVKADMSGDWVYEVVGQQVTITGYAGQDTWLSVPDKISGMPVVCLKGAFWYNQRIENVYIPPSVERIEAVYTVENGRYVRKGTFEGCRNLVTVSGAENVFAYAEGTFMNSIRLQNVSVPKADSIPGQMFFNCKSLTHINIPDTVREIEWQAFLGCSSLKIVRGGKNVKKYGSGAFKECGRLRKISIANVKELPEYMFFKCRKLSRITIPTTVTRIQKGAFAYTNLSSVKIPYSVKLVGGSDEDINEGAFANCKKLKSVRGCKNVSVYGKAAFYNCTRLQKISLGKIKVVPPYIFKNCVRLKNVTLPGTVRLIKEEAFRNCRSLKKMKLTKKIMEIQPKAFWGCKGLKKIVWGNKHVRIYENSFKGCPADKTKPKSITILPI